MDAAVVQTYCQGCDRCFQLHPLTVVLHPNYEKGRKKKYFVIFISDIDAGNTSDALAI